MRRLPRPIRVSLLAVALAAVPPSLARAQSAPVDLPAGPLGSALSTFAGQRGIALAFDPALTEGRQAPPLHGQVDDREGLERLLAGSGLRLIARADGSYTLVPAPAGAAALPFAPLRIGAQRTFPYSEGMALDQAYLEGAPKGDGDIATLLRIDPAVQFSETARSSRNMGEIRPADISINGAPFYQNLFLLDGVSFNNDIDPTFDNPNHFADVPSHSQGVAVDTDLLESVTVYDSNVPAAFGNFTGGVVDAQTRKAGDALRGKLWWRMARSAWDEIIVPTGQEQSFAQSASASYQPRYDKAKFGLRLEGRTASGLGLVGTLLRTRSEIPLRGYTAGNLSRSDSNRKTQTRENSAVTLAADWRGESGLELGASLAYAPSDDRYFIQNANNAWFDLKSGGPVLSLRANAEHGAWRLRNTLSYSDLESSRRSQVNYWKAWAKSAAYDWGVNNSSFEGSWGNVDQHDRKLGYQFQLDREAVAWGATHHALQAGVSYQRRKANYARLNDHFSYLQPYATTSCTTADGRVDSDSCSLSPVAATSGTLIAGRGQYFRRLTIYRAGAFAVSGDEWAAWLQDDIRIGDLSLRPGLRLDQDDIWDRATLAPRLAASWDLRGDRATVLSAGLNRYYGRNFFSYLLREGRERLGLTKTRSSSRTAWDSVTGTSGGSSNRLADVDIPHTDEWTVGVDQRWAGMEIGLKYVNRDNRDEVLRQSVRSNDASGAYATNVYEYVNKGRSRSAVYTLSVAPQAPLVWGGSTTQAQFAFDYTDSRRNYSDYQSSWNDAADALVLYKGQPTWLYDLPATDFARRWNARLSTQTRLALGPGELLWSNFLRYRAGFRNILQRGSADYQGQTLDVYADVVYPRSFSLDTTLEYSVELPRAQQVYARLEAMNVLNRANPIVGAGNSAYYEAGRSYWLEAGYRF
ncbi:TonB-dependent receptor [Xanthomonas sacchari]|uniref:TonB-dependent receptor n=1 Tax=Xanthomonas sacchari TaxID=56458 RepID=UPI0020C4A078|nr:TonB-dependent receptor [Xanthomonas sacchari]